MTDPLQHDLQQAEQRAARYWVQDGLNEIVLGVVFLVVGAYLLLESVLPATDQLKGWLVTSFSLLVIGLSLVTRRIVLRLKDRYVHPRTGYVAFRREKSPAARWFAAILAGTIGMIVALVARMPPLLAWLPALQGLVFGAAFLFTWRKLQLTRFPVEGLLCAAAGLGLVWLRLDETLATGLELGWAGLVMAVGGGLAFRAYLHDAPSRGEA